MTDQLLANVTDAAARLRTARHDLTAALQAARAAGHTFHALGGAAGVTRETVFKHLQRAAARAEKETT